MKYEPVQLFADPEYTYPMAFGPILRRTSMRTVKHAPASSSSQAEATLWPLLRKGNWWLNVSMRRGTRRLC